MPMFKPDDVCKVIGCIWGDLWEQNDPDYIGMPVRITGVSEWGSDRGETTYSFIPLDDRVFHNAQGREFNKQHQTCATIQESALRKVNNGFGQWFKQIKDRDVVGHEAAVAAPQRK